MGDMNIDTLSKQRMFTIVPFYFVSQGDKFYMEEIEQ